MSDGQRRRRRRPGDRCAERIDALPTWVGGAVGVVRHRRGLVARLGAALPGQRCDPEPRRRCSPSSSPPTRGRPRWPTCSGTARRRPAAGLPVGQPGRLVLAVLVLLVPRAGAVATQIAIVTYCMPLVAIGPILVIVAGRDAPAGRLGGAGRAERLLHHRGRRAARAAGRAADQPGPDPRVRRQPADRAAQGPADRRAAQPVRRAEDRRAGGVPRARCWPSTSAAAATRVSAGH